MTLPLPEYDELDGLAMADLVRRKKIAPTELAEAALARMAARNPALNAIVRPLDAMAREMARALEAALETSQDHHAPFAGVPMVIKDMLANIANVPTSFGNRRLGELVAPEDSELVARYRRAGAVFIGKANTPEFGLTRSRKAKRWGRRTIPGTLARPPVDRAGFRGGGRRAHRPDRPWW